MLKAILSAAKNALRLAWAAVELSRARNQAVRGFCQELARWGLPAGGIEELARLYPRLSPSLTRVGYPGCQDGPFAFVQPYRDRVKPG